MFMGHCTFCFFLFFFFFASFMSLYSALYMFITYWPLPSVFVSSLYPPQYRDFMSLILSVPVFSMFFLRHV